LLHKINLSETTQFQEIHTEHDATNSMEISAEHDVGTN
jgi:hypothetical protein